MLAQLLMVMGQTDFDSWAMSIDDGTYDMQIRCVCADPTDTYIYTCGKLNKSTGSVGWVGKFDLDGNLQWQREYGDQSVNDQRFDYCRTDSTGDLYLVGWDGETTDILYACYAHDGTFLWVKTILTGSVETPKGMYQYNTHTIALNQVSYKYAQATMLQGGIQPLGAKFTSSASWDHHEARSICKIGSSYYILSYNRSDDSEYGFAVGKYNSSTLAYQGYFDRWVNSFGADLYANIMITDGTDLYVFARDIARGMCLKFNTSGSVLDQWRWNGNGLVYVYYALHDNGTIYVVGRGTGVGKLSVAALDKTTGNIQWINELTATDDLYALYDQDGLVKIGNYLYFAAYEASTPNKGWIFKVPASGGGFGDMGDISYLPMMAPANYTDLANVEALNDFIDAAYTPTLYDTSQPEQASTGLTITVNEG